MKPRVTSRTRGAMLLWHDSRRCRFVVYRRAGGVTRKTSVRYGSRARLHAWRAASVMAQRLKAWPASKLRQFQFNP